jgi:hypothetical protein
VTQRPPPTRPGSHLERRKTEPHLEAVPRPVEWEPTPAPITLWESRVEGKIDVLGEQLTDVRIDVGKLETSHGNVMTAVAASRTVLDSVHAAQASFETQFSWFLAKDWTRTQSTLEKIEQHLAARATCQAALEHGAGGQGEQLVRLGAELEQAQLDIDNLKGDRVVAAALEAAGRRRLAISFSVIGALLAAIAIVVPLVVPLIHH